MWQEVSRHSLHQWPQEAFPLPQCSVHLFSNQGHSPLPQVCKAVVKRSPSGHPVQRRAKHHPHQRWISLSWWPQKQFPWQVPIHSATGWYVVNGWGSKHAWPLVCTSRGWVVIQVVVNFLIVCLFIFFILSCWGPNLWHTRWGWTHNHKSRQPT